jgi:hypothetical protein
VEAPPRELKPFPLLVGAPYWELGAAEAPREPPKEFPLEGAPYWEEGVEAPRPPLELPLEGAPYWDEGAAPLPPPFEYEPPLEPPPLDLPELPKRRSRTRAAGGAKLLLAALPRDEDPCCE